MKKVQKKASVLEDVFTAIVGFLTGVVLWVMKLLGTTVAVISWSDGSKPAPATLEPKKLEAKKVTAPVKQPKKKETKLVVKKLPRPVLKKRGKK